MVATTEAARVIEAAEAFLSAVCDYDPGRATPGDCVAVAEAAARVEKGASGLRMLAAARAVDAGAHKEAGVPDPVAWVARQGGTTGAKARGALELARSLDAHPETKEALLSGAVSFDQAQEITRAEAESPGQEHELLALAKQADLTRLRDETRERRLKAATPEELHRRQLAARRFRHWRDGLGMVCFEAALPPETGIPLVSRLEREGARLHAEARRKGATERFEAHAADALVALCSSAGGASKERTDLVVVCDLSAWRRGHAHEGEPCQLVGGGPIPVGLAKELSKDAFLKAVLHDGVEIHTVSHHGRHIRAELKTALDLGPVPAFSGIECADCERSYGVEYDHDVPFSCDGPTSYANLKGRCRPCHAEKTERDRKAGLLGKRAKARSTGGRPPPPTPKRPPAPSREAPAPAGRRGQDPPPGTGPP